MKKVMVLVFGVKETKEFLRVLQPLFTA